MSISRGGLLFLMCNGFFDDPFLYTPSLLLKETVQEVIDMVREQCTRCLLWVWFIAVFVLVHSDGAQALK